MYDQPGDRVHLTWDGVAALPSGSPCYCGNHVGFAMKNQQVDRWAKPGSTEVDDIQVGEEFVMFIEDVHELALAGALANVQLHDKLWMNSTDKITVLTAVGGGTGGADADEVQSVKVIGTGGSFKLIFEGEETANIKFNATAKEVREALEALKLLDVGDVTVTGGPGDLTGTVPYLVTFGGSLDNTDVGAMTATDTLTGGEEKVVITTSTAGAGSSDVSVPLGIVDYIDTSRSPHVARVNLSDIKPFITG